MKAYGFTMTELINVAQKAKASDNIHKVVCEAIATKDTSAVQTARKTLASAIAPK